MIQLTAEEATLISRACLKFRETMLPDNKRGRTELEHLSQHVLSKHRLNQLGTNFTLLKSALNYYRQFITKSDEIATLNHLIVNYKGRC